MEHFITTTYPLCREKNQFTFVLGIHCMAFLQFYVRGISSHIMEFTKSIFDKNRKKYMSAHEGNTCSTIRKVLES